MSSNQTDDLKQRRSRSLRKLDVEVPAEKRNKRQSIEVFVKSKLSALSPKFQSFVIRAIVSVVLLILLPVLIFGDFIVLYFIIYFIALQCYREYIRVGCIDLRTDKLPLIRFFAYFVFFVIFNLFTGDFPIENLRNVIPTEVYFSIKTYGTFINFSMLMLIIVVFVLTLKKHFYKRQFTMLGWFFLGSAVMGCSARCLFKNLQKALIWAFLPMSLIVVNDISAYLCGILFGKTPLIKISPKKTWEGFIGSGIITLFGSVLFTHFLIKYPYFYCPYNNTFGSHKLNITCKLPSFMEPKTFQLSLLPTLIVIPPFGGFFASGFKRAYNIKDFGYTIPGHGGMLDRMDCQFFITIFVFVYTVTFVKVYVSNIVFDEITRLPTEDLIQLYEMLKKYLVDIGAIE
ncbi:Phosphatidate cytidylyltransferase, photoreceptor-specific [Thelohanellus kitauei]|uniref:Phosphatidate cytidylyltransferase n=1 Tax=Thelohanellus kitauei TaxID=669202 RepID=A0A0C2N9Z2_THEKT|nr:Phosphatidate cytidylyltransferase, photoreceptor-specific [Thelohanellus kitauei]